MTFEEFRKRALYLTRLDAASTESMLDRILLNTYVILQRQEKKVYFDEWGRPIGNEL